MKSSKEYLTEAKYKNFDSKAKRLVDLESKMRVLYYNTLDRMKKEERKHTAPSEISPRLLKYELEWEDLIEDIKENHPEEWKKHGEEEGHVFDYTLMDMLA